MHLSMNDVRHAMMSKLGIAFPELVVTGVQLEQPFDTPTLFVALPEVTHARELGNRCRRSFRFAIRYDNATLGEDDRFELLERLTLLLGRLEVGQAIATGTGMRIEVIEQALHFIVNYSFFVWEATEPIPKMEQLKQEELIHE